MTSHMSATMIARADAVWQTEASVGPLRSV
ncbi:hypothetical protein DEU34_0130 [Microbacterium sp. AG1240]|nr:hypothetical protein DEU34_0130 [Microbacterium sp. AG1240]